MLARGQVQQSGLGTSKRPQFGHARPVRVRQGHDLFSRGPHALQQRACLVCRAWASTVQHQCGKPWLELFARIPSQGYRPLIRKLASTQNQSSAPALPAHTSTYNGPSCPKLLSLLVDHMMQAQSTRNNSKQQISLAEAEKEHEVQQPAKPFGQLVDFFLNRASSSLKRGPATCLTCKGKGSCICAICQGAGVTDKQPHLDPVRHTAQKFKQVLGVDRSNYNTEWQITNRCRNCHGSGLVLCPDCGGLGLRAPAAKAPQQ